MRNLRKYSSLIALAAGTIFLTFGLLAWQISIATVLVSSGIVLVIAGFARTQHNSLRLLKRASSDRRLMLGRIQNSERAANNLLAQIDSNERQIKVIDHRTRSLLMNDKQLADKVGLLDGQVQSVNKLLSQIDFRTRRIFEQTSSKLIENGLSETSLLISQIVDAMESDLRASNVMRIASKDLHFTLGRAFENITQELEQLSAQLSSIDNEIRLKNGIPKG